MFTKEFGYISSVDSNMSFKNANNEQYLTEIRQVFDKIDSITLKEQIVELVKMMGGVNTDL